MFGLQTTYKQLLSLFRDCLVGWDEKINILKQPLAFFPSSFPNRVQAATYYQQRCYKLHLILTWKILFGTLSPDCLPSTPSLQNCCRHEICRVYLVQICWHRAHIRTVAESIAKEMYHVHKYDLEQGGWQIARVSVCLFEPGAITWIYQLYLYWWQESSGQIITAVREGHWLEDVHKYAVHE